MNRNLFVSSIMVLSSLAVSFAARPFATDDAGTVEMGGFELETAANYWNVNADFGLCLKHGFTNRMDIGVGFGYVAFPEEMAQLSGLEVGLKYALVPDLLSASFSGSFGDPCYAVNLILSKSIGFICLHGNLGMEAAQAIKDATLTYGVAAVFETGIVSSGVEIGGTHEELNWWQVGTQVAVAKWAAIDLGLGGDFESDVNLIATTGLWFSF